MAALILLVPFLLALATGSAGEPADAPPLPVARAAAVAVAPAPAPPPRDAGQAAYEAAETHLAAGRLPIAAHYFQQAARLGHQPADSLAALALAYYRMDNPALGDDSRNKAMAAGALPDSRWMVQARAERDAMENRRRQMDEIVARLTARLPPPPPAPPPAETIRQPEPPASPATGPLGPSPGTVAGAHGCGLLLVAGDRASGKGLAVARALAARGDQVDCLASVPEAPPARNEVWYGAGQSDKARHIADSLPGGAVLRLDAGLRNAIEVRLGAAGS